MTPITGLPQVDGWAQVITHPSGSFFSVLSVHGQNANSVGKNLAEFLMNSTVTNSSQLHNLFLDLLQKARNELCQIQCACLLLTPENRVIAATHSGAVLLKRQEKVGEILFSDGSLKVIEGNYKLQDTFVLLTSQARAIFPDMKERLQAESEHSITKLVADLQEEENSSLITIAWVEETPLSEQSSVAELESAVLSSLHDEEKDSVPKAFSVAPLIQSLTNTFKNVSKSWKNREKHSPSNSEEASSLHEIQENHESIPLQKKRFSFKNLFSRFGKSRFTQERLESDNPPSRLPFFMKASIVLILILMAVIFWKQRSLQKELAPILPVLQSIDQQFEEVKTQTEAQPLESRKKIKELMRQLEDLIAQNQDKKYSSEKIKESYAKIQEFSVSISGTETQGPLEPFFDLRLVEPNFVTKQASLSGKELFTLDAAGKTGVLLNIETKKTQKISLEEVSGETDAVALQGDMLFVLGNGIHRYELGENTTHTKLKDEGDSDRDGILLGSYSTYLYVVNPEKRNIFRFTAKDDTLSEPIGWLIDKQGLDFTSLKSLSLDGDGWLSTQKGEILRYSRGEKQSFTISDLQKPFEGPIQIATHENSDLLYVLDKTNHRVVALQKDGTFVRETVSESLASGEAIVALENEKAVIVISGSLVYKLSF